MIPEFERSAQRDCRFWGYRYKQLEQAYRLTKSSLFISAKSQQNLTEEWHNLWQSERRIVPRGKDPICGVIERIEYINICYSRRVNAPLMDERDAYVVASVKEADCANTFRVTIMDTDLTHR